MSETRDVRETFRQLHAKVLEIMRDVQQAEAQAARSINSR